MDLKDLQINEKTYDQIYEIIFRTTQPEREPVEMPYDYRTDPGLAVSLDCLAWELWSHTKQTVRSSVPLRDPISHNYTVVYSFDDTGLDQEALQSKVSTRLSKLILDSEISFYDAPCGKKVTGIQGRLDRWAVHEADNRIEAEITLVQPLTTRLYWMGVYMSRPDVVELLRVSDAYGAIISLLGGSGATGLTIITHN